MHRVPLQFAEINVPLNPQGVRQADSNTSRLTIANDLSVDIRIEMVPEKMIRFLTFMADSTAPHSIQKISAESMAIEEKAAE